MSSDVSSTVEVGRVILGDAQPTPEPRDFTRLLSEFPLPSLNDFQVPELPPLPDTLQYFDMGDTFELLCKLSPYPLADFLCFSHLGGLEL